MKKIFVKDGKLTWSAELILGCIALFGLVGIPSLDIPLWLAIPIGAMALVAGATLMFEGRATAIGLKPFTNDPLGWRAAKKSYNKNRVQSEQHTDKNDLPKDNP